MNIKYVLSLLIITLAGALILSCSPANANTFINDDKNLYLDKTQNYVQKLPIEDIAVIQNYNQNTRPTVFPIVTAVTYGLTSTTGCMATGAGVAMSVVCGLSGIVVGYFTGYGAMSFVDDNVSVKVVQKIKIEMYKTQDQILEMKKHLNKDEFQDKLEAMKVNATYVQGLVIDRIRIQKNY